MTYPGLWQSYECDCMHELLSRLWSWLGDIRKAVKGKPHEIQLAFKRPMLTIVEEYIIYHINSWRTIAFGMIWDRDCYYILLAFSKFVGMWWCVPDCGGLGLVGMRSFNLFVQDTLHLERGLHQAKEKMQKARSACKICSTLNMLYIYLVIIEGYWMYILHSLFFERLCVGSADSCDSDCILLEEWKTWPVASKSKTFPLV